MTVRTKEEWAGIAEKKQKARMKAQRSAARVAWSNMGNEHRREFLAYILETDGAGDRENGAEILKPYGWYTGPAIKNFCSEVN